MTDIYLFGWYLSVSLVSWFALHSDSFVFLKKMNENVRAERGILLVQLVATWLVIVSPSFTQENSMTVLKDIVEPNMLTVGFSMLALILASLFIPYTFHLREEQNTLGASVSFFFSIAALFTFAIIVIVVLPLEVSQCPCLDGYYGTRCDQSCFDSSGVICSGHGRCNNGCVCDDKFQGDLCNACINEYSYESNCSTCRFGFSLTFDCTKCEVGRDESTNCQSCMDSYVDNNNSNVCADCKAFYFKPSALPSRESYNAFLRVGSDECTSCPIRNNVVCSGHGVCSHWQLVVDGVPLKENANGRCTCQEGYFGDYCDRIPAFDGENTESICNGRGQPIATYEQVELYEEYKETICECNDGYAPSSSSDDACSNKVNSFGQTTGCVYGYYLNEENTTCKPCAGGGFLQSCNSGRGGGICQEDGTCKCFLNYDKSGNGGYSGEDCKSCAPNFFKDKTSADPEQCVPCPAAFGSTVQEACNGRGYCITEERIEHWKDGLGTDTDSDSYAAYSVAVDTVVDLGTLKNYIGTCLCRSGYTVGIDGSCR